MNSIGVDNGVYVLHCKRKTLLSNIISKVTRSRFSHTAICFVGDGSIWVSDAQIRGVQIMMFKDWEDKYDYTFDVHELLRGNDDNERDRIFNIALSFISQTRYDFRSLLLTHPLYLLTGTWKGRRREEALNRLYCSEFVAYLLEFDNYWKTSPEMLFNNINLSNDFNYIGVDLKNIYYEL